MSIVDELEKIEKLKEKGKITKKEFENERKNILSQINNKKGEKDIKQCKKKFCSKCGNEIQEGEKFCGKCGNKIKVNNKKLDIYQIIILSVIVILILTGIVLAIRKSFYKDETSNLNNNNNTETTLNNSNTLIQNNISDNLQVLDIKNNELKINATELIREIISANNSTTKYEYTKQLQDSRGNYNVYSIGNSTLHGTLAAYPFLILENKSTGNVVRICIYYAYNGGTRLNTSSINTNYSILYDALNAINQQELASAIMTIKNNFDGTTATKSVKGLKYGIMDNPNSSGFYLMLGTTMDSLE